MKEITLTRIKMQRCIRDYLVSLAKGDTMMAEVNKNLIFIHGEKLKEPENND